MNDIEELARQEQEKANEKEQIEAKKLEKLAERRRKSEAEINVFGKFN